MRDPKIVIVGDVHGCLEEFKELLDKVNYIKNYDRVILVGDLIDRGKDSAGVVKFCREMKFEAVMGNHEAKFLKWYNNQSVSTYDKLPHYTQFSDEDINYIFHMKPYIKLDDKLVVIHGGLRPGLPIEEQKTNDLQYLRYVNSDQKFVSLKKIAKVGKEKADAHFWTEFWDGPESVIYGHNVNSLTEPRIEEVSPNVWCYGIDTGCCFGGTLTALVFDSINGPKHIVQVKAKQVYYQSHFEV